MKIGSKSILFIITLCMACAITTQIYPNKKTLTKKQIEQAIEKNPYNQELYDRIQDSFLKFSDFHETIPLRNRVEEWKEKATPEGRRRVRARKAAQEARERKEKARRAREEQRSREEKKREQERVNQAVRALNNALTDRQQVAERLADLQNAIQEAEILQALTDELRAQAQEAWLRAEEFLREQAKQERERRERKRREERERERREQARQERERARQAQEALLTQAEKDAKSKRLAVVNNSLEGVLGQFEMKQMRGEKISNEDINHLKAVYRRIKSFTDELLTKGNPTPTAQYQLRNNIQQINRQAAALGIQL